MSLYLCLFEGDREVDGVEVGPYASFNAFRTSVAQELGAGAFPTLLGHSDCDGIWSPEECARLRGELRAIASGLKEHPAIAAFVEVNGESLVGRLQQLVDLALERRLPILFQ